MKKLVSYVKESPALLPKTARASVRESARLAKSVGVVLVWSVVGGLTYFGANPDQSPVTFERELAKIVECSQETIEGKQRYTCLLYTSPSPRDATLSRMPSSA